MALQFIANLIIILCVLGILVIFLRRLPEVVEEKGQLQFAQPAAHGSADSGVELETVHFKSVIREVLNALKKILVSIRDPIWHFMLEAKDLKQSQILASKFAALMKPRGRVINIGAFNSIKKADRLFETGQFDQAEQMYIQVIRKHPHEYLAYESLVRLYFKQKKYDDITEILEFLVNNNPTNDMYLAQLGNVYISTRRFDAAVEVYQKSLVLNQLIPARFVNLGLAQQGIGQTAAAKENFKKAVDLDPTNMQYLMILVDAMIQLGERSEAITHLKAANEREPENVEVKEKLIQLDRAV